MGRNRWRWRGGCHQPARAEFQSHHQRDPPLLMTAWACVCVRVFTCNTMSLKSGRSSEIFLRSVRRASRRSCSAPEHTRQRRVKVPQIRIQTCTRTARPFGSRCRLESCTSTFNRKPAVQMFLSHFSRTLHLLSQSGLDVVICRFPSSLTILLVPPGRRRSPYSALRSSHDRTHIAGVDLWFQSSRRRVGPSCPAALTISSE